MRYFFHVRSVGDYYKDEVVQCFATAEDAKVQGAIIASELARDGSWKGSSVLVTRETKLCGSNLTVKVPISPAAYPADEVQ